MKTEEKTQARAWVGCLGCYNSGRLEGKWIDALEAADVTGQGLATLETVGDYTAPRCVICFGDEFWVMDHEGLEGFVTGECSPREAKEAAEKLQELEAEGLDIGAVKAYLENHHETWQEFDTDQFKESYAGEWSTFEEYAENLAEECGLVRDAAWPHNCIDWERASRELSWDYWQADSPQGVYVFRSL
jgi:antirestriction protein